MTGYGTGQVQLTAVVTAALQADPAASPSYDAQSLAIEGPANTWPLGPLAVPSHICVATPFSFAEIKPFRISNYWESRADTSTS
jgi:hypothetical protein